LDRLTPGAVCAEVGVWRGDFSAQILAATSPSELHLIDPWSFQPEFPRRAFGGAVARGASDMDRLYEDVQSRFRGRSEVVIHRAYSHEALAGFADGYFDWIYIDGNHYYDYVRRDLEVSLRKVRPGGIIAGDDYDWGEDEGLPVERAVRDFAAANGVLERVEVVGTQYLVST
jgi:SAM-dependent methyltransferase